MENSLFYTQFSPLNANRSSGLCNFKIFWGSMPPDTLWKRGLLIQSVTLFKSCWLLQFLLKPPLCYSFFSLRSLKKLQIVFLVNKSAMNIISSAFYLFIYQYFIPLFLFLSYLLINYFSPIRRPHPPSVSSFYRHPFGSVLFWCYLCKVHLLEVLETKRTVWV